MGSVFPPTSWSLVLRLRDPSPEDRRRHLQRLVDLYWKPVYCVIRHGWAKTDEDARDLTQAFFVAAVLESNIVEGFTPERGSFRAFLRGAVRHFMLKEQRDARRLKRGGGAPVVSLEETLPRLGELLPEAPRLSADEVFDAIWTRTVFERAVERLREKLASEGRKTLWEIFDRYDLAPRADASYAELGRALGMTPDRVKYALGEARTALREIVTDIVRGYVDGPEELASELKSLLGS